MFRLRTYKSIVSFVLSAATANICLAQWQHISALATNTLTSGQIPRTWDEDALRTTELPLASPKYSPVHVPASFYYQIPERPIYKSYPVFATGREPNGYWVKLTATSPESYGEKMKTASNIARRCARNRIGSVPVNSYLMPPSFILQVPQTCCCLWPMSATPNTMKRCGRL
jgi:hypothetical protein